MDNSDELKDIPPMILDRDDVDSHLSNRALKRMKLCAPITMPSALQRTLPVRVVLTTFAWLLEEAYGAYYFYELYQSNLQADLRMAIRARLALVDESAAESDSNLMENIEKTIEQYDLLWPTGGPTTGIENSKEKYLASSWSMKVRMKLQRTTVRSSPGPANLSCQPRHV